MLIDLLIFVGMIFGPIIVTFAVSWALVHFFGARAELISIYGKERVERWRRGGPFHDADALAWEAARNSQKVKS